MSRFFSSAAKKEKQETVAKGPEVHLPLAEPPQDQAISRKPSRPEPLQGEQLTKFNAVLEHQSNPHYVLPTNLKDLRQWKTKSRYHRRQESHATSQRAPPCSCPWNSLLTDHRNFSHHTGSQERRSLDEGSLKPSQTKFEALEPLNEQEKCYLTAERRSDISLLELALYLMTDTRLDIQRCLRATRWDVHKAIARSEEIIVWRREYGTTRLRYSDVEEEGRTAKQFLQGYDIDARPIHYMFPDRQNVRHL